NGEWSRATRRKLQQVARAHHGDIRRQFDRHPHHPGDEPGTDRAEDGDRFRCPENDRGEVLKDEVLTLSDGPAPARFERWLPPLLSVIAGMVDLTGFLNLGNLFTAHITGNLVVIGALVVRGGRINLGQILAIPVFVLAVGAVWLLASASGRRGPAL